MPPQFFHQGDCEKERDLKPISPLMDRSKPGANYGVNQLGFLDIVFLPSLRDWVKAFPGTGEVLLQAEANRR